MSTHEIDITPVIGDCVGMEIIWHNPSGEPIYVVKFRDETLLSAYPQLKDTGETGDIKTLAISITSPFGLILYNAVVYICTQTGLYEKDV